MPRCHASHLVTACLVLFFVFVYFFFDHNTYLATELERGYYAVSDSVVEIDIDRRRPDGLDIGILIIVGDDHNDTDYRLALDSTRCYAAMHGYDLKIERITAKWKKKCPQEDFMFARHCVASYLLYRHTWTLFLDADVGVINPNRFLEDYVKQAANGTDLIFYDRFFCWEIAAGSYFVKNTPFSRQFLMKFAELEGGDLPNSFHGRDNGAIHWLFVREFFPNSSSQVDPSSCMAIWRASTDFVDLFVFEACTRLIFGEVRYFHAAPENGGPGIVELLPKGTGWMRDIWLTQSKFSPDTDFMLHGLKHSIEIPGLEDAGAMERAAARRKFGAWWRPLGADSFNVTECKSGRMKKWPLMKSLMVPEHKLREIMEQRRKRVEHEFFESVSKIQEYLKRVNLN